MIIEILLTIIVVFLAVLIFLIYINLKKESTKTDLYAKIEEISSDSKSLTTQVNTINDTLNTKIGEISAYAADIRSIHRSVEQMLRVPKERASFGEMSLETILSDQLPPDMFGIRKKILDGKIPDAYIKSTVGLICIDSRFPLDNYQKVIETEDMDEKEKFKKQFIKDVENHLSETAGYIVPQKGSAEFAFAYIPSEGVYYFLLTDAYELLQNYAKKGVQVVSPLTMMQKIELIKTGVHAKKLSENTEKVRNDIIKLSQRFKNTDEIWRILSGLHLQNVARKAEDFDQAYKSLRKEFDNISKLGDGK